MNLTEKTINPSLSEILQNLAGKKNIRIGIGVRKLNDSMIEGFREAQKFCTPVLYGVRHSEFESFAISNPEKLLITDLEKGNTEAVIRGQLDSFCFREQLVSLYGPSFNPIEKFITLFELQDGNPMIISPASSLNNGPFENRINLIEASIQLCEQLNLSAKIGLLTEMRSEEINLISPIEMFNENINKNLVHFNETEMLVEKFSEKYSIKNYGIDFEKAYADKVNILVEANGSIGNQVIRTIYFLKAARFFGAPVMNAEHIILESFKNGKELSDIMLLASAMVNSKLNKNI